MAKDLNLWTGIGRATKDIEMFTSKAGLTVGKFSIACNGYRDGDVSFFNCVMFGKFAEGVGKWITKGKQLGIHAELKQTKWQDKDTGDNRYGIELIVNNIQLLGGGQSAKATEEAFEAKSGGEFKEDLAF